MQKVALALYVKNEFSDIAGWIAWHLALGINTIFIFDDQSDDGTFNIIKSASKEYDIRYFRTNPDHIIDHDVRHADCLQRAASMAENEFDWIGFLDADEYLSLKEDKNISEFLNKFHKFDAVAINWCIYGSSGKVIRPTKPAPDVFKSHSEESFIHNHLVKSFIRPKYFGKNYRNPHRYYDIEENNYANPNSEVINWDDCYNRDVSWSKAKIMHFVCRSMEHYVSRIKRRVNIDLDDSQDYWNTFNRNEKYDNTPDLFMGDTYIILSNIYSKCVDDAIDLCSKILFIPKKLKLVDTKISCFRLKTYYGNYIFYDKKNRKILHTSEENECENLIPIYGMTFSSSENYLHIYGIENNILYNGPIFMEMDRRISNILTYKINKYWNDDTICLRHISQNSFVSSEVTENDFNYLKCNRRSANEWERFYLKEVENHNLNTSTLSIEVSEEYIEIDQFLSWVRISSPFISKESFLMNFSMLSNESKKMVEHHCLGLMEVFK
ncbi:glycosyltransferase family 2 protein [Gluconobacter kondonii]|uniref:glycosyltransferase family 2 protein n=1 Tax=Gluconobacter kondonii TaxID=941463 RepID=UPI001B8BB8BA|nr:glycosyltransferase family 2 protein [Gluconobacter kondonii]MBS1058346.1 glycosyltransferase family 2 protein [Gluconobacter kondonii]